MDCDSPPEQTSTGSVERLPIDPSSPWWGEHRSRYSFARQHVANRRVLDIACGTGFGCAMLAASGALTVTGVDIDSDTLAVALRVCSAPSVSILRADGTALPFRNETFDVITSFETIEHIRRYEAFVAELRRVLSARGTLILSTPNVLMTARYPRNPFHVYEFRPDELRALLLRWFARVEIYGQHLASYFRVMPFLPGKEKAHGVVDHFRLLAWKIANRLPYGIKDPLARMFTGHHFYPTEDDFEFLNEVGEAPVTIAVCHAE